MKRILLLCALSLTLFSCDKGSSTVTPNPFEGLEDSNSISSITEVLQTGYEIPALAVITSYGDNAPLAAVSGVRKSGSSEPVTSDDKWHIGSITKSITATLVAILVEDNKLTWTTTIGDIFPELTAIDTLYQSVTVEQLLSHTGGILADLRQLPTWNSYYSSTISITDQRTKIVKEILSRPPTQIGAHSYSNGSYIIVGAMIERIVGMSWEMAIQTFIFDPLNMNDCGFGAPIGDSPWGHKESISNYTPVDPTSVSSDNPPVLGPAGTVHVTLEDIHIFLNEHLQGRSGKGVLLPQSAYEKLHAPFVTMSEDGVQQSYGMGWAIEGNTIFHTGSNTMWMAQAIVDIDNSEISFAVSNAMSEASVMAVVNLQGELSGRTDIVQ